MNAWGKMKERILESASQIEIRREQMPADVPAWVRSRTMGLNEQADMAVYGWLQTSRWPECEGDLRALLWLRLWFAVERLRAREIRGNPDPDPKLEQDHLRVYLVSGWYEDGPRWADVRFSFPHPLQLGFVPWSEN